MSCSNSVKLILHQLECIGFRDYSVGRFVRHTVRVSLCSLMTGQRPCLLADELLPASMALPVAESESQENCSDFYF